MEIATFILGIIVIILSLYIYFKIHKKVVTIVPSLQRDYVDVYIDATACPEKGVETVNRNDFAKAVEVLFVHMKSATCTDKNLITTRVLLDTKLVIDTYIHNNKYYSPVGYYCYYLKDIYNNFYSAKLCSLNDAIKEAKTLVKSNETC